MATSNLHIDIFGTTRMNCQRFFRLAWIVGGLLLFVAGCGSSKYAIEGKVVYQDGKALEGGGQIVFEPLDRSANSARGTIKEDGSFRMGTADEADGVAPGQYRVAVIPKPLRNPNRPPPGWPPLDKKYMSHATSGLQCDVTGDNKACNFVVQK
jgi:hypothetical protein